MKTAKTHNAEQSAKTFLTATEHNERETGFLQTKVVGTGVGKRLTRRLFRDKWKFMNHQIKTMSKKEAE